MLLNGSNNRGARGQTPNRSRASRGRGSTSRGASNSSGEFQINKYKPSGWSASRSGLNSFASSILSDYAANFQTKSSLHNITAPSYNKDRPFNSKFYNAGTSSRSNSPNAFDSDRLDNAAKREKRGQNGSSMSDRGGRGISRGAFQSKQVRFSDPPANESGISKEPSATPPNPFAAANGIAVPPSTTSNSTPNNPFAAKSQAGPLANPFKKSSPTSNPFGAGTVSKEPGVAGATTFPPPQNGFSNSSEPSSSSAFGVPSSTTPFNPFAAPSKTNGTSNNTSSSPSSTAPVKNPFGGPTQSSVSWAPKHDAAASGAFKANTSNPFAATKTSTAFNASPLSAGLGQNSPFPLNPNNSPSGTFNAPAKDPSLRFTVSGNHSSGAPKFSSLAAGKSSSPFGAVIPNITSDTSGIVLAQKLEQHLRRQGISPPKWPTPEPGDPSQKNVIKDFWMTPLKRYRNEVRESLIKAGYLDDPDKPKKLSEAIDFKGTCEDMCPEFEKFTRIVDTSVDGFEKERGADGTMWPSMGKMVKALARSSAGQEAPLPMDVRTPAALRRTLDYLLNVVLGDDNSLPKVHGFLWNRTRAIRRDFIFQQSAMQRSEMVDQIYCLERITRFHVIALHQMSRQDFASTEDYSEQQEIEQLGKSLLSLIHAYEDCHNQKILCENEAEFRSYYILFNNHNTAILETVQDWGLKFWRDSDNIKTAVALVEALQNIWDARGPLKPYEATDVAHNAFAKFFSIVQDRSVSYTMACFAEVHFNNVRKAILQTVLTSYRKQRDQTKDWTLSRLNTFLRFDDEADIIPFGEAYGLNFEEADGEDFLSFESGDDVESPFPPLKQGHSRELVERKRGRYSLAQCMDVTVYEEAYGAVEEIHATERDNEPAGNTSESAYLLSITNTTDDAEKNSVAAPEPIPVAQPPTSDPHAKPTSIFSSLSKSTPPGHGIFAPIPTTSPTHQNSLKTSTSALPSGQLSFPPSTIPTSSLQSSPFFPSFQPSSTSSEAPKSIFSTNPSIQEQSKPFFDLSTSIPSSAPSTTPEAALDKTVLSQFAPTSPHPPNPFSVPTPSVNKTAVTPTEDASPSLASTQPTTSPHVPNVGLQSATSNSISFVPTPIPLAEMKPSAADQDEGFSRLNSWYTLGKDGIIDQFTALQVEQILKVAVKRYLKEEAKKIAKEADELAKQQADEFRYKFLATKYGNMWREGAHRLWLKRRAREARQARKQMTESLRASRTAEAANLVEDFKASTRRRNSLESLLDAPSITNGGLNPNLVDRESASPSKKRQRLDQSKDNSFTSKHKRGRSENPLRRSLLSDPSYLTGGSRIHLLSSYGAQEEARRHASGVRTDYFRLKARGITTLPDGRPLANSVARDLLHSKTSFDGVAKPATPKSSRLLPSSSSVPSKFSRQSSDFSRRSVELEDDIPTPRLEVNGSMMIAGKTHSGKRSVDSVNDDEALFARAKRIRDQMDEGAKWFRKQIDKDTPTRSVS